ncbi:MAG: hypothetical protein BECKG1743D_GA0114223_105311 [Candidatus Kentron sp. G]|nr:MAG: hypothetical protein BECKG1743F_GA0114225_104112 [Candidatus Kentron sp. G]VFN03946.1 MAG: hypothetical protein BECKG1743D_GA0114223_105311 [Candidatus Kentron sp. G]
MGEKDKQAGMFFDRNHLIPLTRGKGRLTIGARNAHLLTMVTRLFHSRISWLIVPRYGTQSGFCIYLVGFLSTKIIRNRNASCRVPPHRPGGAVFPRKYSFPAVTSWNNPTFAFTAEAVKKSPDHSEAPFIHKKARNQDWPDVVGKGVTRPPRLEPPHSNYPKQQ